MWGLDPQSQPLLPFPTTRAEIKIQRETKQQITKKRKNQKGRNKYSGTLYINCLLSLFVFPCTEIDFKMAQEKPQFEKLSFRHLP